MGGKDGEAKGRSYSSADLARIRRTERKLSPKVALCCLARHSHNLHSRPWQALPQAGRAEPTPCTVLICKCVYITAQRVHNS